MSFRPTQTGLCKFRWAWSPLIKKGPKIRASFGTNFGKKFGPDTKKQQKIRTNFGPGFVGHSGQRRTPESLCTGSTFGCAKRWQQTGLQSKPFSCACSDCIETTPKGIHRTQNFFSLLKVMFRKGASPGVASGVTPGNQTKERPVHELFPGAFPNKSSM